MPTDRLLRIVESNETSTHLVASVRLVGRRDHAIDDGLAVLRFAGLKKSRIVPGLDEIALGVDPEEPASGSPLICPPRMNEALKPTSLCSRYDPSRRSMSRIASETRPATSNIVPRGPQVWSSVAGVGALLQHADHRLRAGEIPGAQQDEDPIARALEDRHLAEFREVVDAGVSAGVGREDDAVVQQDPYAIRHALRHLGAVIDPKLPCVIVPCWRDANQFADPIDPRARKPSCCGIAESRRSNSILTAE